MNQDIKMLCDLMIKNCDHSLDRIKAQIEQLTRMIGDYRDQVECLRAENRALKRLLEQEHGLDKKRIQRIVAVLQQRNFQVIQGGKSCTNTEQQLDG